MTSLATDSSQSPLLALPQELLTQILGYLLTPDPVLRHRYRLHPSVLATSQALYSLGTDILYTRSYIPAVFTPGQPRIKIPPVALQRIHRLALSFSVHPIKRGECILGIPPGQRRALEQEVERVALLLRHSDKLQKLRVELLNMGLRKVGARIFKSDAFVQQIRQVLCPLAFLPERVSVNVVGYDTAVFAEEFDVLRSKVKEKELPWERAELDWCRALMDVGFDMDQVN